ncbi:anthrone oxygenase family protein [Kitasatospora sp. NPDC050543]|uniref:anthrone oxygenase family protein n=1 Tax=Kitasatospora sp. NPDC050543 TaxID=3364054 RepID=UPI0037BAE90F
MSQILLPLALIGSGMGAGGLMIASLGGAPLLLSLPVDRYIPVHQFLVTRFDPFMPICMITAMLADIAAATLSDGSARGPEGVAAVLLLGAIVVSLVKNVPINKWVGTLEPGVVPPDWERIDPRVRWRNWNVVRTAFVVIALLANALAAALAL